MHEQAQVRSSPPGRGAQPESHAPVPGRDLRSFDEIIAGSAVSDVPGDVRGRFEAAHGVDLAGVRVHHAPDLAEHGIRGLSRGPQIALAALADREALEHELGHVVDCTAAGGAAANAVIDGLELADDPAREARADQLAAQAKQPTPPKPRTQQPLRAPAAGGAPQPKLTNRTAIARNGAQFAWQAHKTAVHARNGGGFEADGLGAVLSTTVPLALTGTTEHGQLATLEATTPPQYVDDTRPALPAPPQHYRGHQGCYVLPAALLGAPTPANLLYLPPSELAELAAIQTQMIDLAKKAPSKLAVTTQFGPDGLASSVSLTFDALERTSGATLFRLTWTPALNKDRTKWGAAPSTQPQSVGAAPASAEWRTHIEWDAPHASGDGVKVVAHKLGPDHPLGSTPNDQTAADRVTELQNAAKKKKGKSEVYIAGHLLNDHLGGPGTLSANLAPIPKKANSQMTTAIEKPAKKIVNEQRGWIRYEVRISHKKDPKNAALYYPSRIRGKMSVYDASGALKNPTDCTIDIDPPSAFAGTNPNKPTAVGALGGAALESSPAMLDEVILSHENDLRPFLRDGAELFELIVGSDVNAAVPDAKLSIAWTQILEELRRYEVAALPNLNALATTTSALECWRTDAAAKAYLANVTAGELRRGLFQCFRDAQAFATTANGLLQRANAVVKKTILPSDLFRNAQVLAFADELVKGLPERATMLQVMMSQQHAAIPFRNQQRRAAQENNDVAMIDAENQFRDEYLVQEKPEQPSFPSSPLGVYEQYGRSVEQISNTSMYGAKFESGRMKKVLAQFIELLRNDGVLICNLLRDDEQLKTSKRLQAILTQLANFMQDRKRGYGSLALDVESIKPTWEDSLEMLAQKEPKIAKRLYELLKID